MKKQPQKLWNGHTKMVKIGMVLTSLVGLAILMACSDTYDAQMNATATAQAFLALTPAPTPTFTRYVTDIVTHHHSDDGLARLQGVITGATDDGRVYRVDVTEGEPFTASSARVNLQQDSYDVFDALYASSSGLHPDQVTVRIFGPVTDKYGNTKIGQWAVAMLTRQTEEKFNWSGLDYASAWAVYDHTEYLVNGL